MNTLRDLRATLDERADAVDDTERYVRPVSVRARIDAIRRRRASGAAIAAVIALVATVAAVGTLRAPHELEPVDRSVAGVDLPGEIEILGFPYDLDRTATIAVGDDVTVPTTTTDQAVTLAASGLGTGSATLYRDGEAVARVRAGERLALPVPIYDAAATFRLRLAGTPDGARAGLAVYRATGELADGVSDGTSVFRDTVAGNRLITAGFASQGATSVSVRARGRLDRMQIATRCTDETASLWINVSVDGDGPIQAGRCDDSGLDNTPWATLGSAATGRHTFTAYATRGEHGPRVAADEVGVGVYTTGPGVDLLHTTADETLEYAGRSWRLTRVVRAPGIVVETVRGDALLGFVGSGEQTWATWRGSLDRGRTSSVSGGGSITGPVLLAGDRYTVRLRSRGPGSGGALLVYRPL